jgi:hypothetical protein
LLKKDIERGEKEEGREKERREERESNSCS